MPDNEAATATLAGNTLAFAFIIERHQRSVYALTLRMLRNAEDAADAAQETFLRAYFQLASYDKRRPLVNWLLGIASHYCIDVLRKRRHGAAILDDVQECADARPGPDQVLLDSERRLAVRALVQRLTPEYRLVIVLRYWHKLSCEEIAQISKLSVPAVKTRLFRARALLVKTMDAEKPFARMTKPKGDNNELSGSEAPALAASRQCTGDDTARSARGTSSELPFLHALRPTT